MNTAADKSREIPKAEDWVEPQARPDRHVPPSPKSLDEQRIEHDVRNEKRSWVGESSSWLERTAAPIGSREALIAGITEAILQDFKSSHPGAASGSMPHSWLKERIDAYDLSNIDQEVRHAVPQMLEHSGVKVSK